MVESLCPLWESIIRVSLADGRARRLRAGYRPTEGDGVRQNGGPRPCTQVQSEVQPSQRPLAHFIHNKQTRAAHEANLGKPLVTWSSLESTSLGALSTAGFGQAPRLPLSCSVCRAFLPFWLPASPPARPPAFWPVFDAAAGAPSSAVAYTPAKSPTPASDRRNASAAAQTTPTVTVRAPPKQIARCGPVNAPLAAFPRPETRKVRPASTHWHTSQTSTSTTSTYLVPTPAYTTRSYTPWPSCYPTAPLRSSVCRTMYTPARRPA